MTRGTIRDIRTGRAVGRTQNLSDTFTHHISALLQEGDPFYLVYGRCRMIDSRVLVDDMKSLDAFPVIYDSQFPADSVFIFEGHPDELGFAC